MVMSTQLTASTIEAQAIAFFKHSVGNWQSRRRYYTLASDQTQEVVSDISIAFLESDHLELIELGNRHELSVPMICGAKVTWESTYISPSKKPSVGETVFGIRGDVMYRDRGFATPKPVTADYRFKGDHTMVLRTEYGGSSFEEELKLVGENYRTRQTIISRAGEEIMIGQYLEKRM
ncbi:phycobiliprotein lyase [cf. Phormidesmis sp. LEGE 11477]|uniref:phycobiliprotein lyase n=1 Tax=cf. Phormidesmis sp. LEGE 11477 TaxID=1828680 RepID=UPI001882909C|nr:phycobiliprotein lyase [cf. Phormidesmis sp. LEGE 11477]MBE9060219.1 phycobiliprotein lyase [cf. Phormidesmis sp. LEGE 11477]